MPLLDHFHPPLSERRQWHSFHSVWASIIALDLNRQLPPGYFADPNVKFNIEIDVAAFEDNSSDNPFESWLPPSPTLTAPMALITDVVEVAVYNSEAGPVLIGAIELISPANKDRPETRDAFVSKCASYLQQAVGVIVVDLVTDRKADLHAELLKRVTGVTATHSELWAAAYRPWQMGGKRICKSGTSLWPLEPLCRRCLFGSRMVRASSSTWMRRTCACCTNSECSKTPATEQFPRLCRSTTSLITCLHLP